MLWQSSGAGVSSQKGRLLRAMEPRQSPIRPQAIPPTAFQAEEAEAGNFNPGSSSIPDPKFQDSAGPTQRPRPPSLGDRMVELESLQPARKVREEAEVAEERVTS